jgi:hypothetical protein
MLSHGLLERFSNTRALTSSVQGGFFLKKKPLSGGGFGVEQLENRLLADNTRVGAREQVKRKARA